jgi:hypothetical protein
MLASFLSHQANAKVRAWFLTNLTFSGASWESIQSSDLLSEIAASAHVLLE